MSQPAWFGYQELRARLAKRLDTLGWGVVNTVDAATLNTQQLERKAFFRVTGARGAARATAPGPHQFDLVRDLTVVLVRSAKDGSPATVAAVEDQLHLDAEGVVAGLLWDGWFRNEAGIVNLVFSDYTLEALETTGARTARAAALTFTVTHRLRVREE